MTSTKDLVRGLEKTWGDISERLFRVRHDIARSEAIKAELLEQLDGLLKTFQTLGHQPTNLIIPPELMFKADASIGDAIETVLKNRGALTRLEIRKELQKAGKLKTRNARIILANAIKKDGRKRFRLKDGKIYLNEK